jgi:hypothetical protein
MGGLQDATHYGLPPRISFRQQTLLIKFVEEAGRSRHPK